MSLRDLLLERLAGLENLGLRRRPTGLEAETGALINVCANDYLGYAAEPVSRETSAAGAGASRLIHGTRPEHLALEREVADWVRAERALVFSSGYAANVGAIAALAGPGDLVVSDELNHASLIDGCRLSRARVVVVRHRDLGAAEAALQAASGQKWVVTESYFSMDAVTPDLPALRRLCDSVGAFLYVDEAHALGVFGPGGAGLCAEHGVVPDALVGTLGKAVGVQGAFVAGTAELAEYLWNRARSFVFSTAVSPVIASAATAAVRRARRDDDARRHLVALEHRLEESLRGFGVALARGRHGPIFPIVLETPDRAVQAAAALRAKGFLVQAIRPPTVPNGTSRLRVALNARLRTADVDALALALRDACSGS